MAGEGGRWCGGGGGPSVALLVLGRSGYDEGPGSATAPRPRPSGGLFGGYHGAGVSGPTSLPSPFTRKGRCHMSFGTSPSPGLTFSGKMNSNVGAVYWPGTRSFAAFGALLKHESRAAWSTLPAASPVGVQSERAATFTVRVGWLSRPVGAFVARIRSRWGWAPVHPVEMPPLGLPSWFSPVISNGVTQRFFTDPSALTSCM